MKNKERRKEIRFNKQNTFQFKIVQADLNDPLIKEGLLIDYSAAGIRFMTDEKLDKNLSLLIQIDLGGLGNDDVDWRSFWETDNEEYLNVIGSVMWCLASSQAAGKFEVGTRFTQKSLEQFTL